VQDRPVRTAARVISTTPITETAGLTLISSVISLTSAGSGVRTICRRTIRRKRTVRVMPKARAASSWSAGKASRAARQISQLKAMVPSISVIVAAVKRGSEKPSAGVAK
jgi:hypothetical protein